MSIADDGKAGLWIGTESGLDHLDPATGKISTLRHDAHDPDSLPNDRVYAVLLDRRGVLWVATSAGLARRDVHSTRFVAVPLDSSTGGTVAARSLFEDDRGRIWIGTTQNGAYVLDTLDGRPQPVEETDTPDSTLRTDFVNSISASGAGEVWLGTYGDGIVAIDAATRHTRHIRHDPKVSGSLLHDQVWGLLQDRAGSMWIGSTGGLDRLANDGRAILTVFGGTSRETGASAADVVSVLSTPDGRIWLGYANDGVDIIDPVGGRRTRLRPDSNRTEAALPKGTVAAMVLDADGVFIGTDRGLYRADRSGKVVSRVRVPERDPTSSANALLLDAGTLWIGGGRDGLWAIAADGATHPVVTHLDKSQLTDPRVNVIIRGTGHDLWIGTANGLDRLDLATGTVERIVPDAADSTALAAGYVSALMIDREQRLWVGTLGGGINVLTGRGSTGIPHFLRLATDQGLPNSNIDKLLEDAQGKVWASTDDGLAMIDPASLAIRALRRAEGVAIPAYWVNSGAITGQGELLFGGTGGLTVVRPEQFKSWSYHPRVVITDALIGGKPVAAGRFNGAGSVEPLTITPKANSFAVEFSALDFTAPERNRYEYRLEGFDREWIDTDSTRRLAAYTNLSPGSYLLQLRGSNRNGQWTKEMLRLPVRVLPAWYQTWLFRLAVALVVALAVVLLVAQWVRVRTAYLREAQLALEALVAKRTEELNQSKLQLEEIAFLDALTGLPNRRLFNQRFEDFSALSRRDNQPFTLLLTDLDKFKAINDTYGHDAGDAVLIATTERLKASTREVDVVARLGGDEFAILLSGASDREAIRLVCERIAAMNVEPIAVGATQFVVSMSIGAAVFGMHGRSQADLYKSADLALYEAKSGGRNTWRLFKCSDDLAHETAS